MKKTIGLLMIVTLVLAAFPLISQAAPLKKLSWRAEYYDNPSLAGPPQISRFEAGFGFDWGHGSPALEIPKDRFSARWTRVIHLEEGTYLFVMDVDDGARVWVDGRLIIDAWDLGRKERLKARIQLDETGDHEIQIAYFEHTGQASIHLEWLRLGGEDDIVGAWTAEYFNNPDLTGDPIVTRQEAAINYDWNSGSPHPKVSRDNFSVRWTRSIYLKTGKYHFRLQHDDGMRFYIDGKIVYDSWFDQSVTYKTGIVPIKEGYRTFTVEYYDHIGNAVAQLSIDEDPGDYEDVDPGANPGLVVDNDSQNFRWSGPLGNRFVEDNSGFGGNFYWTYNTPSEVINVGRWTPSLSEAGNYEVLAYIPQSRATTSKARYHIYHFGRFVTRTIDQSRYSGEFVSLGIYYFDAEGSEYVTLPDNTGEGESAAQIAYDAMRFVKR